FGFGAGAHPTIPLVTLTGTAEPGAAVVVVGSQRATVADVFGAFTLTDVALQPGLNPLTVRSTDAAGNVSEIILPVTMHDVDPPAITLTLAHDTGTDPTDLWTMDPTANAVVTDASPVT